MFALFTQTSGVLALNLQMNSACASCGGYLSPCEQPHQYDVQMYVSFFTPNGEDEPKSLSYAIRLHNPVSANGIQAETSPPVVFNLTGHILVTRDALVAYQANSNHKTSPRVTLHMLDIDMLKWAKDLFPIARSLTGDGVRTTFEYLKKINPEIVLHSYATGDQVFDWEVPQEWSIRDAYFEHIETGEKFCEFQKCNLHILGYSEPVNRTTTKEELISHIYTQPNQPELIPYVTSYYTRRWGFCMPDSDKEKLPDGDYKVVIDSNLFDGEMLLGDAVIQGELDEEIMFSSYICHPSMANNELSGPVLLSALMQHIKQNFKKPKYSYRFIFVPETIGSIAYLSRKLEEVKSRVVCGFNISCVGDNRAYSHVVSRYGNTLADKSLSAALFERKNVITYSFLKRGSDERQYCAPGIDLPVAGFCRSKYGEYPEYHTNADNFNVVTQEGLAGSLDVMTNIINSFEIGLYPNCLVKGEPQLGKRGLYPTISQKGTYGAVAARMNFLTYADGSNSLFDIVKLADVPLSVVLQEARIMLDGGLISMSNHPQ